MRFASLSTWSHRRQSSNTPLLAPATSRWSFVRRHWSGGACSAFAPELPQPDRQEIPIQRVAISLPHHLDVALATRCLLPHLNCDDWHVTCRHEHQMVVQLTRGSGVKFGISFDCSPPVEKAVYHGSRAWALTVIPLHGQDNLTAVTIAAIKAALGQVHA